jgi:hypothetical protein
MRRHPRALALILLMAAGCGGGDTEPLSEVRGQVFFRGKPLEGGTIVFVPDPTRGGGGGPLARAEIQSDGRYRLSTGDRPGAVAGWHRVTVATAAPAGSTANALSDRYRDPETSGQCHEVKPGQENTIDLHLD